MKKTSPVGSADVSDPVAELFRFIAKDPPCKGGAVVDLRGGGRPPPELHELIEESCTKYCH